jgi:hypothetical protein
MHNLPSQSAARTDANHILKTQHSLHKTAYYWGTYTVLLLALKKKFNLLHFEEVKIYLMEEKFLTRST